MIYACKVCEKPCPRGRRSFCSDDCRRISEKARARSRYLADRDGWIARSAEWRRNHPDRSRELGRDYAKRHRSETRERERAYVAANRDRYNNHARAWYVRNQTRARESGRLHAAARRARILENGCFVVTERDLQRALSRYENRCAYCRSELTEVHWDHVVPIAKGGAHAIGNLAPSCPSCNHRKSSKTLSEWRFDLQSLTVL